MRLLALCLALLLSASPALADYGTEHAHGIAQQVVNAFDQGQGHYQVGAALNQIVATATRLLKDRGLDSDAAGLNADWAHMQELYFQPNSPLRLDDMGDHDPLSQWLANLYDKLLALLGQKVMDMTHLSDIKVFNFATPVVFHPKASEKWCVETLKEHPEDTCIAEYRRHFAGTRWQRVDDPFAKSLHDGLIPVICYWLAWGACEAATWGTGWFIICTPIGDVCEVLAERYLAPPMSDKIFNRANGL